MKRTTPTARLFTRVAAPMVLAGLLAAACSNDGGSTTTAPPVTRIVVTSVKGDTASELLAAIYARVLEDSGFSVARRDPVEMDRAAYYEAVQEGTIQLIPDWSGDLLHFVYSEPGAATSPTTLVPTAPATTQAPVIVTTTTIETTTTSDTTGDTSTSDTTGDTSTGETSTTETSTTETSTSEAATTTIDVTTTTEVPLSNGRSVIEQVVAIRAALPDTVDISSGLFAEDKTILACTPAALEANADTQLITFTNLASNAPSIRLGASAEWQADDVQGLPAFTQFYGGEFAEVVTVEEADLGDAITNGEVDCLAIDSLNPLITTERLTLLVDDRTMLVGNGALALLSSEIATPDLVAVLDSLASSLTTERLNQMLNEVNANGTDVNVVANAFVDTL